MNMQSNFFGVYKSKKELSQRTPKDIKVGSIAFVTESHMYYEYKDYGDWAAVNAEDVRLGLGIKELPSTAKFKGLEMSLYDINKQIISQLPEFTEENLTKFKNEILPDFMSKNYGNYYTLLSKEASYYTLFRRTSRPDEMSIADALLECISYVGVVKDVSTEETSPEIAIWIQDHDSTNVECYHFFNYDMGVVEFH